MAKAKVPQPPNPEQGRKNTDTDTRPRKHFLDHHLPHIEERFNPAFLAAGPPPVSQQRIEAVIRLRRLYEFIHFELENATLEIEAMLDRGSSVEPGPLTCGLKDMRLYIWEDSGWPEDHLPEGLLPDK